MPPILITRADEVIEATYAEHIGQRCQIRLGRLIDLARAEPVTVEKHGRPVVVVLAIEEYEHLREIASGAAVPKSARMKRLRMSNGELNWIANFIWEIADDALRDLYVRGKYRDVILPMMVLRRLDAVLEPTKGRRARHADREVPR